MDTQISLYLDKRRQKQKGTYPLKIRVWDPGYKKAKLYPGKLDLSEDEFLKAWLSKKPRKEFRNLRTRLNTIANKAETVAAEIHPFSFETFEKRLYRKKGEGQNLFYHYDQAKKKYQEQNRIGTAEGYDQSQKALKGYLTHLGVKDTSYFPLQGVNSDWLQGFENYMVNEKERSITTVSIYLRALRSIYNNAIEEGEIPSEYYPFGKKKYQIPSSRNVKKALTIEDLKKLFNVEPDSPEQQKAKDFWFLSYACNGINAKDIAKLRFKDLEGDKITFYRSKTINTNKADLKPIVVYLNDLKYPS